ncbi:MAG: hypothetical protein ACM33B_05380 [Pseudomonadota bacterium]
MRRLALLCVACALALALPAHAKAIGQCGLPSSGTWWIDFGSVDVEQQLARPGVIVGASTGTFPARLRTAGAETVYWDMYLNRRVGQPAAPADPSTIVPRANSLFEFAAAQSGCEKPIIALNELFGAHLETPWSATNQRYRENVLAFVRQLASRGARPFLLISTTPYTGSDEAAAWWREVAKVADLVPEVYFGAPSLSAQGPVVASRRIRVAMRERLSRFLAIGIPASRLGVTLGFQTGRGAGGREGLQPDAAWYEVVKWQGLAARQIVAEYKLASVWSWGWGTYTRNADDDDKPAAICVYLWTRSPSLCDGPAAAGPDFDASRTEGQIRLPASRKCGFVGGGGFDAGSVAAIAQVTDDRSVALTVLLARTAEAREAPVTYARVLAAERAVIAVRFAGSAAAYRAALARAKASPAVARAAIADELRRLALETRMAARPPSAAEVSTFYASYPDLLTRSVEARPAPWWLGGRTSGLAIGSVAPDQVFSLPGGRRTTVRALDGTYTVTVRGEAQPLGSVPLAQARLAIAGALRAFARRAAFESWTTARQTGLLKSIVCTRDELPTPGPVRLTSFLPFLSLTGGVSGSSFAASSYDAKPHK